MTKLLPCPFCGGTAYHDETENWCRSRFIVKCVECDGMMGGQRSIEGAIIAWNSRYEEGEETNEETIIDYDSISRV